MPGFVVSEAVESSQEPGDTAAVKVTIDRRSGSERLEQRVLRFARANSRGEMESGS